jgi:putative oxidoreductase
MPEILQAFAAVAEFGGGIALVLGFFTRLATLSIGSTMIVAIAFHRFVYGHPFISSKGGGSYELASVYLAICIVLLVLGPGRFSFDKKLF